MPEANHKAPTKYLAIASDPLRLRNRSGNRYNCAVRIAGQTITAILGAKIIAPINTAKKR
jgi:hypothetical protein